MFGPATFSPSMPVRTLLAAFLLLPPLLVPARQATIPLEVQSSDSQVPTLLKESQTRVAAGDADGAQRLLVRVLAISPNSPEANLLLGNLLLSERHYPEAMERFETLLSTNRRSSQARAGELAAATALALQSRRLGNQDAALACLQHARESLPDDPTLLRDLGIQAFDMHLLTSASEALAAAIALAPDDPQNVYALARVEAEQQHFPPAERHFRAYLAARPDDATAHYGLGHLLQMQQRTDEAAAEFNRSIELQPQQTESYFQLGQMALDQHRDNDARTLFNRTLSRAPGHGGSLTGLGILAYRSKDYAMAAATLREAITHSPDYQPAHYYLGLSLARLHDPQGSERELKLAAELDVKQQGKAAPVLSDVPQSLP